MVCERAQRFLARMADGQLPSLRRWLVSRHLARCAACSAKLDYLQTMQSVLRTSLPFHSAPPALASRIGSALARELPPAPVRTKIRFAVPVGGLAGAVVGVALTVLVIGNGSHEQDHLAQDLIADHVRSLMADHLTDVRTEDRHTVKPWLSERLEVSPRVRDLAADGFPMIGGRLDYVAGHRAAAIVYRRDRHTINLFAWAVSGARDAAPAQETRSGFNLIMFRRDGIAYCAVSDLEANQLMDFANRIAAD